MTQGVSQHELDMAKYLSNADDVSHHLELTKFNRFNEPQFSHELYNTKGYIFMTKPDLNIFEGANTVVKKLSSIPEFHDLFISDPGLFQILQYGRLPGPYLTPIHNHAQSLDMSDIVIKTREGATTSNEWKMMYGTVYNESVAANDISIQFEDSRDLIIYKLHYIWMTYIHLVTHGDISPKEKNIIDNIIDYEVALYYFLTAEDGETIIFHSKYVGLFPKNIPSSTFSWTKGEFKRPSFSINYQYFAKFDMHPLNIIEFNELAPNKSSFVPLYNKDYGCMERTWVGTPFIEDVNGVKKLRWSRG